MDKLMLTGRYLKLQCDPRLEPETCVVGSLRECEEVEEKKPLGGKRSKCKVFSPAARKRMMTMLSQIETKELPLFVTLTYGRVWSEDYRDWKTHLDKFLKRLKRKFPKSSGVWKLEPQERGAPHYHLLLYGVNFIDKEWLALAWAECSGDVSQDHIEAGTSIEKIEKVNGAAYYASKYVAKVGKEDDLLDYWQNVGQWWGYYNKVCIPFAEEQVIEVTSEQSAAIMKFLRYKLETYKIENWCKANPQHTPEERAEKVEEFKLDPWIAPKSLFVNDLKEFIFEFCSHYNHGLLKEIHSKGLDRDAMVKGFEHSEKLRVQFEQILDEFDFCA